MTINPRDYDIRELRRMANPNSDVSGGSGGPSDAMPERHTPDEVLRIAQREELVRLEGLAAGAGESPEKPYLSELPKQYECEVTVFEWLDFLINKGGFRTTGDALSYYDTVDWITQNVREELRTYMRGFSEVESFDPDRPGPHELDKDDHVLSLVYIARLASMA